MKRNYLTALLATAAPIAAFYSPAAQAQEASRNYDIAAQPLADALRQYSRTSGRDVLAPATLVAGKRSPGARGSLSADAALSRILRGTGLVVELVDGSFVVREGNVDAEEAGSTDGTGEAIIVTGSRIRGAGPTGSAVVSLDREAIQKSGFGSVQQLLQSLPQAFGGGPNEAVSTTTTRNGGGSDSTFGSSINLRGLGTSSTLVLIDNARPALGGIGGVFADISLIPVSAVERIEVLTDGASAIYGADAVAGVVNVRMRSRFEGAETMLRAGTADGDTTELQFGQIVGKDFGGGRLVLAYQYSQRGALAAADRDFAREDLRAFGGPDYRSNFAVPGTITAVNGQRFGIPAGQGGRALTAAQLLPGVQNRYDGRANSDILPRTRIHSLYAAGEIDLTDTLTLRASALAAQRRYSRVSTGDFIQAARVPVTNPFYVDPIGTNQSVTVAYRFGNDLGPQIDSGRARGLTASAGFDQEIGRWRIQLGGAYGHQRGVANKANLVNRPRLAAALADTNPATAFNVFGDGTANNPATIESIRGTFHSVNDFESWSAALRGDGPLFRLPGGEVRLAIGAEYRRENFDYYTVNGFSLATPFTDPFDIIPSVRKVRAAYAELLVPVFGPDNEMPGFRTLDISLAGRAEKYSDVGSTENPKIGVRWEPVHGIALRGSYGKSFRAPAFDELIGEAISLFQTEAVPDPASPTGTTNILGLFGYAPDVGPERATTWTAGVDIAPPSLAGFKASVTYYDVDYRDRIGTASEDYTRFLVDRARFGGLVTDNPPFALVQSYFASPSFVNAANIAPNQVAAILDGRIRNLAAERQRGIDFDVGYMPAFAGGTLELGLAGTHIFSIKQQLTPGGPQIDVVGTYAKPVKWRLRGRLGWATDGFSANAFVNYTDGYLNQVVTPMERVASWTTFDISASQRIGGGDDDVEGRGLRLGLGITNLFDKDPPYVNNRSVSSALGYDPEKASPLGRLMSLQATIRW